MTPNQIALIAETWALLAPSADQFAALYYQRLDKVNPDVRRHFPASERQSRRLASLLDTMIATLDLVDNLVPALQAMGVRYAGAGVTPEDYRIAGEALLWTLEQALGQRFGGAERKAWREAMDTLTSIMLQAAGANGEAPAAAKRDQRTMQIAASRPAANQAGSGTRTTQAFAGEPAKPRDPGTSRR